MRVVARRLPSRFAASGCSTNRVDHCSTTSTSIGTPCCPTPPGALTPPMPCGIRCRLANKLANSTHVKAARDHAYAAIDLNREPNLLPRPLKTELGKLVGISAPAVSRCFNDPDAHELRLLWKVAGDLEAILKYGR